MFVCRVCGCMEPPKKFRGQWHCPNCTTVFIKSEKFSLSSDELDEILNEDKTTERVEEINMDNFVDTDNVFVDTDNVCVTTDNVEIKDVENVCMNTDNVEIKDVENVDIKDVENVCVDTYIEDGKIYIDDGNTTIKNEYVNTESKNVYDVEDTGFICRICGNKKYKGIGKEYWCTYCGAKFINPNNFNLEKIQFVKLNEDAKIPSKAYPTDTGFDLFSTENVTIESNETKVVGTGIALGLPHGLGAQIRSKSGLASKGIQVANSPGTIDNQYSGEIKVIIYNSSTKPYTFDKGDKLAQMTFEYVLPFEMVEVKELMPKDFFGRGTNGFGSTGK